MVPAYASDLMVTEQGTVSSVITWSGRRIFTVDGEGTYIESATNYVASGQVHSGRITYGVAEQLRTTSAEFTCDPLPASGGGIDLDVLDETGAVNQGPLASATGTRRAKSAVAVVADEWVELRTTLTRTAATSTPTLTRLTLRAMPLPFRVEEIWLPIQLHELVGHKGDQQVDLDPYAEWAALRALMAARAPVTLVMGSETLTVVVDGMFVGDEAGEADSWTHDDSWFNGVV